MSKPIINLEKALKAKHVSVISISVGGVNNV